MHSSTKLIYEEEKKQEKHISIVSLTNGPANGALQSQDLLNTSGEFPFKIDSRRDSPDKECLRANVDVPKGQTYWDEDGNTEGT